MKRYLRWLVFIVFATSSPAFAEDSTPRDATTADEAQATRVESTGSVKTEEQKSDTKPVAAAPATEPAADDIPKTKSPEVFVPTEDISEDLAVSFPVDI